MPSKARNAVIFLAAFSLLALPLLADRTAIRTGWNLFSVQQDIEMGRDLKDEANSVMSLSTSNYAKAYVDSLGQQLATHAPGYKYTYEFRIFNDSNINSFALPGGFIYVSSGLVETAGTEPQLAGVLAHQIAHVVLRHGTQQASQAYASQVRNPTPGRVPVSAAMSRLDIGFDSNSVVLKYSAEAEAQADLIGAQILYDAGFDPRQMPLFLQQLRNENRSLSAEFFLNHPVVTNRVARVRRELQNMGGLRANLRGDSPDLHTAKKHLRGDVTTSVVGREDINDDVASPSSRLANYRARDLDFRYPENWRVFEERGSISIAPDNGMVSGSLAYGMTISTFEPTGSGFFGNQLAAPGSQARRTSLSRATNQLIEDLKQSNPNMRVAGGERQMWVDGDSALSMELSNDSPLGGRETNWLVTVLRPNGMLYYFIGVAPQREFNRYKATFEQMIESVRFVNTY